MGSATPWSPARRQANTQSSTAATARGPVHAALVARIRYSDGLDNHTYTDEAVPTQNASPYRIVVASIGTIHPPYALATPPRPCHRTSYSPSRPSTVHPKARMPRIPAVTKRLRFMGRSITYSCGTSKGRRTRWAQGAVRPRRTSERLGQLERKAAATTAAAFTPVLTLGPSVG